MDEKHMCPVCGDYEFNDNLDFDYCPYCGWRNDPWQEENPLCCGLNMMSLCEAQREWIETGEIWV